MVLEEHSSGGRRRQGAITLTGNRCARRTLIESAWSYRFPARQTAHLKRKASDEAKAIGWRAQKCLCGRYRTLIRAGKNTKLVCGPSPGNWPVSSGTSSAERCRD